MKFLQKITALFTNNWKMKLVSLLLAIAVYHIVKIDSSRNQDHSAHDRPLIQIH